MCLQITLLYCIVALEGFFPLKTWRTVTLCLYIWIDIESKLWMEITQLLLLRVFRTRMTLTLTVQKPVLCSSRLHLIFNWSSSEQDCRSSFDGLNVQHLSHLAGWKLVLVINAHSEIRNALKLQITLHVFCVNFNAKSERKEYYHKDQSVLMRLLCTFNLSFFFTLFLSQVF